MSWNIVAQLTPFCRLAPICYLAFIGLLSHLSVCIPAFLSCGTLLFCYYHSIYTHNNFSGIQSKYIIAINAPYIIIYAGI